MRRPKRDIGVLSLTFVAVGGVVGSGWLFAPLFAVGLAGPASILSWVLGGLMILLPALAFAEVAAMLPVMGGLGRLPHFSHGNVLGMFVGWTAWIGYVTAAPIEAQALLEYASNEPQFRWLFNEQADGAGRSGLSVGGLVVAFGLLVAFTVINAYGVKLLARVNTPLTWFKILVPVVAAVALLSAFDSGNFTVDGFAPDGVRGVLAAVASGGVVFAFLGFRHAIDLAGEAKRPGVTVPVSLIGSITICIVLFVLVQFAFVGAVSADALADGWGELDLQGANGPIAAILTALGLSWAATLVLADAVVGPFGAGLVASGSTARLAVAVSRNGLFPRFIQSFSRHHVPLRALILNAAVGMVILVVFRDGWQEILTFNTGAIVLSFCVGPVTLVALRRSLPDRRRPFRLPAVGLVGATGFVVVSLIVYWSGWDTMWKLSIPLAAGLLLFGWQLWREPQRRLGLEPRPAIWTVPYVLGLLALSYAGNYGGGRGWLPELWDVLIVGAFALALFPFAVGNRLSDERVAAYVAEDEALHEPTIDALAERGLNRPRAEGPG